MGPSVCSLPYKVSEILGKTYNFTHVLIDDLVEGNKYYKEQIKNLIESQQTEKSNKLYPDKNLSELTPEEMENVNNEMIDNISTPENIKAFEDAYFYTRKKVECSPTGQYNPRAPIASCDVINDMKLRAALGNGQSIVFESTGEYFPDWLFSMAATQLKIYYGLLKMALLSMRLIKMFKTKQSLKTFKSINDKCFIENSTFNYVI